MGEVLAGIWQWLGSSSGMVLIAAILGALVAGWGVLSQRFITSRRTTIEVVQRSLSDRDLIRARKAFINLARQPSGLGKWANPRYQGSNQAQDILTILNEYELIAIGIQSGIIDMGLYKKWSMSTAIADWQHAAPFVHALRSQHSRPNLFIEFEDLVREMSGRKPHRRNYFWAKFF